MNIFHPMIVNCELLSWPSKWI